MIESTTPNVGLTRYGDALDLEGDLAVVGAPWSKGDRGEAYLLGRDVGGPNQWGRFKVFEGSSPVEPHRFGAAAALSGSTVAIGAPHRFSAPGDFGEVHVFERDLGGSNQWGQARVLLAPSGGAFFGAAVGLDGDTLVIGSPGTRELFVHGRDVGGPGNWGWVETLTPAGGNPWDTYAEAVALEGDFLAVNGEGVVHVYERSGTWTEVEQLVLIDGPLFASALDIDDGVLAAGSPLESHSGKDGAGAVYLFERSELSAAWPQVGRAVLGPNMPKPREDDFLGTSVALSNGTLLAGAPNRDVSEGRVFLFSRDGAGPDTWEIAAGANKLSASDPIGGSNFGQAVALDAGRALVGAPTHPHASGASGAVYLFEGVQAEPPLNYCTAGVSASGCSATLSASGSASATLASGFVVTATGIEGGKDGLFFYGTKGQQANSWGSGTSFQCVVPPVIRGGLLAGSGTNGACDGSLSQDLTALWTQVPAKNPGPGAEVSLQLWYRDPLNSSNQTTSLSDGLRFVTCP